MSRVTDSAAKKGTPHSSPPQFPLIFFEAHRTHTSLFNIELINCSSYLPHLTIDINMAKTTTLKEFESVFPKLVEDILDHAKQYNLPEEFVQWYKAVGNSP